MLMRGGNLILHFKKSVWLNLLSLGDVSLEMSGCAAAGWKWGFPATGKLRTALKKKKEHGVAAGGVGVCERQVFQLLQHQFGGE